MMDKRASPRHRTLKGAHIVFNNGASTIDCIVRDLSETGARLKVTTVLGIPDLFDLLIEGEGIPRPCRVARRSNSEIGVSFTATPEAVS